MESSSPLAAGIPDKIQNSILSFMDFEGKELSLRHSAVQAATISARQPSAADRGKQNDGVDGEIQRCPSFNFTPIAPSEAFLISCEAQGCPNFFIRENFLGETACAALRAAGDRLKKAGRLQLGATGRGLTRRADSAVRGDLRTWVDPQEPDLDPALRAFLGAVRRFVEGLARACPALGLTPTLSCQLAWYPPSAGAAAPPAGGGGEGAGYVRHRDALPRPAGAPPPPPAAPAAERFARKLTVLYYLNPEWTPAEGGCLRLFHPDPAAAAGGGGGERHLDVGPRGDTLVVFRADKVEHAVRPTLAARGRMALTCWFHEDLAAAAAAARGPARAPPPAPAAAHALAPAREVELTEEGTPRPQPLGVKAGAEGPSYLPKEGPLAVQGLVAAFLAQSNHAGTKNPGSSPADPRRTAPGDEIGNRNASEPVLNASEPVPAPEAATAWEGVFPRMDYGPVTEQDNRSAVPPLPVRTPAPTPPPAAGAGAGGAAAAAAPLPHARAARIFVSIASYRDPEARATVLDLLERAAHPERVFVGVVHQVDTEGGRDADCLRPPLPPALRARVTEAVVDCRRATGPCWARRLAQALWRGEEYCLQLDSHMRARPGWDVYLVEQLRACPAREPVLTAYPPGYALPHRIDCADLRPTLLCPKGYVGGLAAGARFLTARGRRLARRPTGGGAPVPSPLWAAGFSFARGDLAVARTPYEPRLHHVFFGEEAGLAARLWTRGADFFAPAEVVFFHLWSRRHRPDFRADAGDGGPAAAAAHRRQREASERRLMRLFHDPDCPRARAPEEEEGGGGGAESPGRGRGDGEEEEEEDCFGLGRERGIGDFFRHLGVAPPQPCSCHAWVGSPRERAEAARGRAPAHARRSAAGGSGCGPSGGEGGGSGCDSPGGEGGAAEISERARNGNLRAEDFADAAAATLNDKLNSVLGLLDKQNLKF